MMYEDEQRGKRMKEDAERIDAMKMKTREEKKIKILCRNLEREKINKTKAERSRGPSRSGGESY